MTVPLLELPILDDDGRLYKLAPVITLGVMYFPNDAETVSKFVTASTAGSLREEFAEDKDSLRAASGLLGKQSFWRLLGRDKEINAITEDAKTSTTRGSTAANVLTVALRMGAQLPRLASVNNAVKIVMLAKQRGRSGVLDDWGQFKPVSHLWAAAFELEWIENGLFVEMLSDEDSFCAFLSFAAAFHSMGGRQQVPGAREPLLPSGTVSAIPTALQIKPAEINLPLEEWMVKEIGSI